VAFSRSKYSAFKEARLDLLPEGSLGTLGTVVDIGAHNGDWAWSVLISSGVKRLIAMEPNPTSFTRLQNRVRPFPHCQCLNVAAGSGRALLPFQITKEARCCSLLLPQENIRDAYAGGMDVIEKIDVRVEKLDDLLADTGEVSLMKIDVQGYERDVLEGAKETLTRTKWLLIEVNFISHYAGDLLFADLDCLVRRNGFVLAALSAPFCKNGQVLWADALYRTTR